MILMDLDGSWGEASKKGIKTSNNSQRQEILAPVNSTVTLLLRPDFHYLQLLRLKGEFYHEQERKCRN